jgi:hypothetical protein
MSTVSLWCRYCGVENRPFAKSCYICGKPLVAPNPRQQVPLRRRNIVQMKKRGFWLSAYLYFSLFTLLLTIVILSWLFIALLVKPQFQQVGFLGLSNLWWELILDIVGIIALICIGGIWFWKKWGVYGIVCIQILGILYSFIVIVVHPSYWFAVLSCVANIIWSVIIILLFRHYWDSMN